MRINMTSKTRRLALILLIALLLVIGGGVALWLSDSQQAVPL